MSKRKTGVEGMERSKRATGVKAGCSIGMEHQPPSMPKL
jgi:hypothetical protein